MEYKPTIGLEVHAELATKTKMFCDSVNDPDETHPNINICPICTAHPGTLPTINKEAVREVIRTGLAFGGAIAPFTYFERKNYFYPDLPKGYQISQYAHPLVSNASFALSSGKHIRIRRIHLEEDTAALTHQQDSSLVDHNRAGAPLMELVTEPDFSSAAEVKEFANEFQTLLRYVGASRARLEQSELRFEANVSLNMGTKVELKNIGSLYALEQATLYEIERQRALLDKGEKVRHETRGWNEVLRETVLQRSKEEAHDYRYFPEPDLPPFAPPIIFDLEALAASLPELPWQKRARFIKEFQLDSEAARLITESPALADFFEQAASELAAWAKTGKIKNKKEAQTLLSNYFLTDLRALLKEKNLSLADLRLTPENFAELIAMIGADTISSRGAKEILRMMVEQGGDPSEFVREHGLGQVSDTATLEAIARRVIEANPKPVADFKAGKETALQFLVGQLMRESKGAANPTLAAEILKKLL
jgi:aspartyl-tRNA(Asn)/glutamyl-tRNA(Gln) amidotransferase subunit B